MTDLVSLKAPYLLFLGDADSLLSAKTAAGIAHWRPERCLAQFRLEGAAADTGLPDMGIEEAVQAGAKTLVIGLAPLGGRLPDAWIDLVIAALEAGLDVASGLHSRLGADPRIAEAARRSGQRVLDVREPPAELPCGSGERRERQSSRNRLPPLRAGPAPVREPLPSRDPLLSLVHAVIRPSTLQRSDTRPRRYLSQD